MVLLRGLLLSCFFASATAAFDHEVFVDPRGGDDALVGSSASPLRTVHAVSCCPRGARFPIKPSRTEWTSFFLKKLLMLS
jgi:hypothetical protein